MNKSFIFLALFCVLLMAATAFAQTQTDVAIRFKNSNSGSGFSKGLPTVIEITIDNVAFDNTNSITFTAGPTADEQTAHPGRTWQALNFVTNTASSTNPLHSLSVGYVNNLLCRETTNGKALAKLTPSASAFKLDYAPGSTGDWKQKYNAVDGYGKWVFECPIEFAPTAIPYNTFSLQAAYSGYDATAKTYGPKTAPLSLEPASNFFTVPDVEFVSASLSQDTKYSVSSSQLDISFTTNSTGLFTISTQNGLYVFDSPIFPAFERKK